MRVISLKPMAVRSARYTDSPEWSRLVARSMAALVGGASWWERARPFPEKYAASARPIGPDRGGPRGRRGRGVAARGFGS